MEGYSRAEVIEKIKIEKKYFCQGIGEEISRPSRLIRANTYSDLSSCLSLADTTCSLSSFVSTATITPAENLIGATSALVQLASNLSDTMGELNQITENIEKFEISQKEKAAKKTPREARRVYLPGDRREFSEKDRQGILRKQVSEEVEKYLYNPTKNYSPSCVSLSSTEF